MPTGQKEVVGEVSFGAMDILPAQWENMSTKR